MPIYAYECGACGVTHDFLQKMGEGRKRKCPSCGELRLRKLVTAAAFHLKGTGWYATDFRDKDKKKQPESGAEKGQEGESKTETASKKDSSSSGDEKSSSAGKAPASTGGGSSSAGASAD
jgi:putative FmdB family regulatory protein